MDPVLLVGIISGASAIVASVGAQLIAAAVTAKQSSEALKWEKEQRRIDLEAREKSRFEDVRRESFVSFLTEAYRLRDLNIEMIFGMGDDYSQKVEDQNQKLVQSVKRLAIEIKIVAPQLTPEVHLALASLQAINYSIAPRNEAMFRFHQGSFDTYMDELSRKMTLNVAGDDRWKAPSTYKMPAGVDSPVEVVHNRPQLNEAPMSGDKQAKP